MVERGRMYAGKNKEKEFNTANKKEKEGKQWLGQSDRGRGVGEQSGNEMGHLHLAAASASLRGAACSAQADSGGLSTAR